MSLFEAMDAAAAAVTDEERYRPSEEFGEELRDPLVDIDLNDSTELWLIQWPYKQNPDFNGKELSLELHGNGWLGSFEDSTGKVYDVVSNDFQEPDATVFLNSPSEPKIVGKISRRISLVHYPEPKELEELNPNNLRQLYATSSGASLSNSARHFASPAPSSWRRNSQSTREHSSYTRNSSRYKSSLSGGGESSKPSKRRHGHASNQSTDRSTMDSAGRQSGVTTSFGSSEHSHQGKSKKKLKAEE